MRNFTLPLLLSALIATAGLVVRLEAAGRRGDYVSTADDKQLVHPVKRGSAANPNPAFQPPRFDSDQPARTEIPNARPSSHPTRDETLGSDSQPESAGVGRPAHDTGTSGQLPPAEKVVSPAGTSVTAPDSSEPPLPDGAGEVSGKGIHPPAR